MSHRTPFAVVAVAAAALTAAAVGTVRAQDHMMGGNHTMAPDGQAGTNQMGQMKSMAADPAQAQAMAAAQAKMLVLDRMAADMAKDPKFQQMLADAVADVNVRKVHDDAKHMADDPAQVAKIKQLIMDDPKMMEVVMHLAAKIVMAKDEHMIGADHMMGGDHSMGADHSMGH